VEIAVPNSFGSVRGEPYLLVFARSATETRFRFNLKSQTSFISLTGSDNKISCR